MTRRRVMVLTGTRAEFGLLAPVMRAIRAHPELELAVAAGGCHLLGPEPTVREVEAAFGVDVRIPMQAPGAHGRLADGEALGRGIGGVCGAIRSHAPDWLVVLGDRVEALAGACAGAVAGVGLAHVHGGDRAEGIADESIRHAISKLAHLHLAATPASAGRLVRMGERPATVVVVGSPALDDLPAMPVLDEREFAALGSPAGVVLLHPSGGSEGAEGAVCRAVLEGARAALRDGLLALDPNHDAGRDGIVAELARSGVRRAPHLARRVFIGLLRRVRVLIGNSSAGLIECAAIGCPAVNVGPRQAGRERCANVLDVEPVSACAVEAAVRAALDMTRGGWAHPYGDGRAGVRCAAVLAGIDPHDPALLRKRNMY